MRLATRHDSGPYSTAPPLSARLRQETAAAHRAVEAAAGLPGRVVTLTDYADCLGRFFCLFAPLETAFEGFGGWAEIGINLVARRRAPALLADLRTLGRTPSPPPPARISGFAAALGALYVLEGSALGGKILSAAFTAQLPAIAGATRFFGGDPAQPGGTWQDFRAALDVYGEKNPAAQPAVVAGAAAVFRQFAIGLA